MKRSKRSLMVLLLGGAILTGATGLLAGDQACWDGVFQEPNSTVAVAGYWDERTCVATHVDSAGLLMLEAAPTSERGVGGRLDLHAGDCGPSGVQYVQRGTTRILASVPRPGDYIYCVTLDDPSQSSGAFKVVSGFLPQMAGRDDREEDEPDPDPFSWADDREEDEPDPDPFTLAEDREEDEPDPDPFIRADGRDGKQGRDSRLAVAGPVRAIARICDLIDEDDHGNASWCATRLEARVPVTGEIGQPSDLDVFTFSLSALTSVRLTVDGDALVALLDANGLTLAAAGHDAEATPRQIVKTLAPGEYFVRIEAPSALRYALTLSK